MESRKCHAARILSAIERADWLGNLPVLPDEGGDTNRYPTSKPGGPDEEKGRVSGGNKEHSQHRGAARKTSP